MAKVIPRDLPAHDRAPRLVAREPSGPEGPRPAFEAPFMCQQKWLKKMKLWASALFALLLLAQGAFAQTPAAPPPEKVQQLLGLLNDPEVKAWLEAKHEAAKPEEKGDAFAAAAVRIDSQVRNHLRSLGAAFERLPEEVSRAMNIAWTDVNSGRPGKAVAIFALLVAAGAAAERLMRRELRRNSHNGKTAPPGSGLLPLAAFMVVSFGVFFIFDWPPLLHRLLLTALTALMAFRFARAIIAFIAAMPERTTTARLAFTPEQAAFWDWRLGLGAALILVGWAVSSLSTSFGFTPEVTMLLLYGFGLLLLVLALECLWRRPGRASKAARWLLSFYLAALWLVWVAGLIGLFWIGVYALLLPTVVPLAGRIAGTLFTAARRPKAPALVEHEAEQAPLADEPKTLSEVMMRIAVEGGARIAVMTAAFAWLAHVWRLPELMSKGWENTFSNVLKGVIVVLAADLVWRLARTWIEWSIGQAEVAGGTPQEIARKGRLRTLLPIFRNGLAAFIIVVAGLTVLSSLGVAIGPLIASAGVVGVAIGFGSQTLVKDVISGVFYMLDDAFRVGEYIQSGSYKGTVESFSLRSVRLRHQRGPVFTVPFGSLGAVQNMSRDWVIHKFTINVTYDSDLELARKLIKQIGLDLAADPEFAAATLEPLKMQGVDSFGEFAIVLRLKLKTRPGEQTAIVRTALLKIKQAFDANGVKVATPTVQVSGDGGSQAAAGAAAQETRRRRKVKQAAEAVAEG